MNIFEQIAEQERIAKLQQQVDGYFQQWVAAKTREIERGPVRIVRDEAPVDHGRVQPIYWPDYRLGMYVDGSADEDIWRHVTGKDVPFSRMRRNGDW